MTDAGKRLWRDIADKLPTNRVLADGIDAIEAEAEARERQRIKAAVGPVTVWYENEPGDRMLSVRTILAIIDGGDDA
jgi:hypothetical protein